MTRMRADLLLVLAAAIWGLAFVFQKTAMNAIGPLTFIAARGVVAALALMPLALLEDRYRRPSKRLAPTLAPSGILRSAGLAGLAFFVAAAFQQFGLRTATATNGGFLTALYVVLTPPLAFLLRGTPPGKIVIPAALLSAIGTWLLGGGAISQLSSGDWLIAACAIFWALHVILSASGAAYERPILFTGLQFAVVGFTAGICAWLFEPVSLSALKSAATEILYVGLLSSALTFTLLTFALNYAPASEAAVIISTESLFAALAGALMLDERLPPVAWLGAAMIMAAVLLVQLGSRASNPESA